VGDRTSGGRLSVTAVGWLLLLLLLLLLMVVRLDRRRYVLRRCLSLGDARSRYACEHDAQAREDARSIASHLLARQAGVSESSPLGRGGRGRGGRARENDRPDRKHRNQCADCCDGTKKPRSTAARLRCTRRLIFKAHLHSDLAPEPRSLAGDQKLLRCVILFCIDLFGLNECKLDTSGDICSQPQSLCTDRVRNCRAMGGPPAPHRAHWGGETRCRGVWEADGCLAEIGFARCLAGSPCLPIGSASSVWP
jgi:hypothetical protein